MQNLQQYWQGKLENAKDANDMKLTLANMKSEVAGQSKTALAAGIGLTGGAAGFLGPLATKTLSLLASGAFTYWSARGE